MNTRSGAWRKQCRVVDIDVIRRNVCPTQLEDIRERKTDERTIVARVADFALAAHRVLGCPKIEQSMLTGRDCCKKSDQRSANGLRPDQYRRVAKPKTCIRGQELYESRDIARIDCRKQSLPPLAIGYERSRVPFDRQGSFIRVKHATSIRVSLNARSSIQGSLHAADSYPD